MIVAAYEAPWIALQARKTVVRLDGPCFGTSLHPVQGATQQREEGNVKLTSKKQAEKIACDMKLKKKLRRLAESYLTAVDLVDALRHTLHASE